MGAINSTDIIEELPEDITDTPRSTNGVKLPNSKLIVVLLYSFMSLAIFFNLRVIYIVVGILCKRSISSTPRQVGGSNQHAFVYVLCLSIVDSLVLAHLPLVVTDILINWVFGVAVCKLFWIAEQLNRILSTFVLTALSGDRFLAVCYPIRFRKWRTTKAAVIVMIVCVIVAGLLLTPTYMYSVVKSYPFGDDNRTVLKCTFDMDTWTSHHFLIYIFVSGYCIPFISIVFFYGCILRTLWKKNSSTHFPQSTTVAETNSRIQRGHKRAQHVTQRALVLVLFYFGCWTPYWALQIYLEFIFDANSPPSQLRDDALFIAMYVVHALTYLNSAVNPFLYALLNKELHSSANVSTSSSARVQRQASCNSQLRLRHDDSCDLRSPPNASRSGRNHDANDNLSPTLITRRCFINRKNDSDDPNSMPLLMPPPCTHGTDKLTKNGSSRK